MAHSMLLRVAHTFRTHNNVTAKIAKTGKLVVFWCRWNCDKLKMFTLLQYVVGLVMNY